MISSVTIKVSPLSAVTGAQLVQGVGVQRAWAMIVGAPGWSDQILRERKIKGDWENFIRSRHTSPPTHRSLIK